MEDPSPGLLRIEREELLRLEHALSCEWLETDGRGGYAASTLHLCNTRRYHGLLVAPCPGTVRRHVFLSRLEEQVHESPLARTSGEGGERAFPLSMARYRGLFAPLGHVQIESFELAPWPRWVYRLGAASIERELLFAHGSPTVLVRWRLTGGGEPLELRVRPLLAMREADALHHENLALDTRVEASQGSGCGFRVRPYGSLPPLQARVTGAGSRFEADPLWYRGAEYALDLERGYDGHEDLFSPGELSLPLGRGRWCVLAASIEGLPPDPAAAFEREAARRREELAREGEGPRAQIRLGADDFLYQAPMRHVDPRSGEQAAGERLGVIAGFPWFGEWGRDTAIALPGLLLSRDRVEDCGAALEALSRFLRRGLLPNVLGLSPGDSSYDSADAALWFSRAVLLYDRAGGSPARLRDVLLPALTEIAERHLEGTELGIASDTSGLLRAGSPALNATWMDARTSRGTVTPRDGFAVELNALWYQLLAYLGELQERFGARARSRAWRALAQLCAQSFTERFWLPGPAHLADTWKDGRADASVRPNMVVAAALELSPLSLEQRAGVVARSELELLTPRGLRTLSPADPAYRGRYRGGPEERDLAYHQGTVWPWLLGFQVEATLRAFPRDAARRARLRELLAGLVALARAGGLNHVSEVFDGDPPHRPGGTFAQAWNSAEILRAERLLAETCA